MGELMFIREDGTEIPVKNIPKDLTKIRMNTGYTIGDYIYQYRGVLSRETKKYLTTPGSILRIADNYVVCNFDKATDVEKRLNNISHTYWVDEKISSEDIIDEYIYNYKMGNNLIIGNEMKLANTGELYIPELKEEDDALTRIMKLMIIHKKIVLSNYSDKTDKDYSIDNLRSGLNGATINMAVTKFLEWCKLLDLEWEFRLIDNGTDTSNPILNNLVIGTHKDLWLDINEYAEPNIFQVACNEGEDPLKRLIKVCIIEKQIVLSEYKDRGSTPHLINNMRSALKRKSRMMFPYFTYWCEILGVDFVFKLIDPLDGHIETAGVDYRQDQYTRLQNRDEEE